MNLGRSIRSFTNTPIRIENVPISPECSLMPLFCQSHPLQRHHCSDIYPHGCIMPVLEQWCQWNHVACALCVCFSHSTWHSADSPCHGVCQWLALGYFLNIGSSLHSPTAHRGIHVPEQTKPRLPGSSGICSSSYSGCGAHGVRGTPALREPLTSCLFSILPHSCSPVLMWSRAFPSIPFQSPNSSWSWPVPREWGGQESLEALTVKGLIRCDKKPAVGTREGMLSKASRVCANLSFLSNCLQTSVISTHVVHWWNIFFQSNFKIIVVCAKP